MLKVRKLAAAFAATGLAAFGAAAVTTATAGIASAATNLPITSCNIGKSILLELSTYPTCTAGNGTTKTANYDGSFKATTTISTESQTVDLATAVGSPEPTQCTVENLTATSLLVLNSKIITASGSRSAPTSSCTTASA